MKILIIGNGGREHALAWKCAQSTHVDEVLVAPGNAGTAREQNNRNIAVSADDIEALASVAQRESVDMTIVGPEAPLVAGIVDRFNDLGLPCFGPSAAAAQLEGSKAFSKETEDTEIKHSNTVARSTRVIMLRRSPVLNRLVSIPVKLK